MPLKTSNNQATSVGQEYSAIEDVVPKTEESYATESKILKQPEQSSELGTTGNKVNQLPPAPFGYTSTVNSQTNSNKLPPPYSVAVNRNTDCAPVTNIASQSKTSSSQSDTLTTNNVVRFQQTNNDPDLEDSNGIAGGIFPAARARLASLKSLGSKKLNAIKMRLSDNRQKLEECEYRELLFRLFSSFVLLSISNGEDLKRQTTFLITDFSLFLSFNHIK